jgi:hypothetical protein
MKTTAVLLPSDKVGWEKGDIVKGIGEDNDIVQNNGKLGTVSYNQSVESKYWQAQELYLISDSKVCEGDWCLDLNSKNEKRIGICDWSYKILKNSSWKKVIASTHIEVLPRIPNDLIQFYVKQQGKIDEVEIKTFINSQQHRDNHNFSEFWTELRLQDNKVIWIPEKKFQK